MRASLSALVLGSLLAFGCARREPAQPQATPSLPTPKPDKAPNCKLGGCQALPTPEDLKTHIEHSEMMGVELYLIDYAAALATDIALTKKDVRGDTRLGGYLPLREATPDGKPADSYLVTFFSRDEPPQMLYQARIYQSSKKPDWIAYDPPKPTPKRMQSLIKARQNAIDAVVQGPSQPLNPIALPLSGGIVVYLLAGTTTPNLAIMGKHTRILLSEDGETIQDILVMSKNVHGFVSDLDAKNITPVDPTAQDALEMPYNKETGVFFVTQISSDWPLESQVFLNLLYEIPIYVATDRGLWLVENGRISFLSTEVPGKPTPSTD